MKVSISFYGGSFITVDGVKAVSQSYDEVVIQLNEDYKTDDEGFMKERCSSFDRIKGVLTYSFSHCIGLMAQ